MFDTTWKWIVLFITVNWGICLIISWLYVLWLWKISNDIKFEGLVHWKFIPVPRFRLISKKSWYAKIWDNFYGFGGLLLAIIHRDEIGKFDDSFVDKTIVHEMRHVFQVLVLGTLFWILFGLLFIFLAIIGKHPYRDNPFEIDARAAANKWDKKGRPAIYTLGKRR